MGSVGDREEEVEGDAAWSAGRKGPLHHAGEM